MTAAAVQLMVIAKAPVAGQVKTRLCPPYTPEQAARLAAAALADTLDAVGMVPAAAHTLVLSGRYDPPAGWRVLAQRGGTFGARLAHAFRDAALPGLASLLVGMDTPQLTTPLLRDSAAALLRHDVDAVFGPAEDGGWWGLGLREPMAAAVLAGVPMSTPRTGSDTLTALRAMGLRIARLPMVRDVDTAEDAHAVARECATDSRFARAMLVHAGTGR